MALTISVDEIIKTSNNPLLKARPTWKRVRLGDIADVLNGYAFKAELFNKSKGIPLIRIRDIGRDNSDTLYSGEFDPRYVVNRGDLLVGMDGDFNCDRWRGETGLLNQRVCKVSLHSKEYDEKFLDYVLPGYLKAINDATSSVTVKHLSSRTIQDIALPFPQIDEQKAIVEELEKQFSRLDEAIVNLKRVKTNLKRYKASMLKDAVEGRLVSTEAEFARHEGHSYETGEQLLQHILDSRRKHWKGKGKYRDPVSLDSNNLPSLPEGWTWATLDMIGQQDRPIIYGIIKPGPHIEDGIPYVRVTEMKDGFVDLKNLRRTSPEQAAKFARATLAEGDLLISKDGTIGRVAVVPAELTGGNITQHVMRAPINQLMCREYVIWSIRSEFCQNWLAAQTKGVALRGVNVEDFRRLPIPIPPLAEQIRIQEEIERRTSFLRVVEAEVGANLKRAQTLRQAILAKSFAEEN